MNQFPENALHIIFHVNKTAGTTLRLHLRKNYRSDEILELYGEQAEYNANTREDVVRLISQLTPEQKRKIKFIIGHKVFFGIANHFPDRTPYHYTFLRNPLTRVVSHYNDNRKRYAADPNYRTADYVLRNGEMLSLSDWQKENPKFQNFTCKFFQRHFRSQAELPKSEVTKESYQTIVNILDSFSFIGTVENENDLLYLYGQFGITRFLLQEKANVSPQFVSAAEITDAQADIQTLNQWDMRLYEFAKQKNTALKVTRTDFDTIVSQVKAARTQYLIVHIPRYLLYRMCVVFPLDVSLWCKQRCPVYARMLQTCKDWLQRVTIFLKR